MPQISGAFFLETLIAYNDTAGEEIMKLVLKSKKPEIEGVRSFIFEPQEALSWQPGQYLHYILQHDSPDDRGVERWFTIAAAPFEKNVRITTRFDGERESSFKAALFNMEVGSSIEADGPKGSFTLQPGEHRHILIAGGIGITPYRSMLAQLAHDEQDAKIELLYANRDDNFVFGDELKELQAKIPSFNMTKFIDKRIEVADLESFLKDSTAIYYLSGPRPLVENYEKLLTDTGVAESAIMTDYFPGY
jgi:ferredoxin-NADP reductase